MTEPVVDAKADRLRAFVDAIPWFILILWLFVVFNAWSSRQPLPFGYWLTGVLVYAYFYKAARRNLLVGFALSWLATIGFIAFERYAFDSFDTVPNALIAISYDQITPSDLVLFRSMCKRRGVIHHRTSADQKTAYQRCGTHFHTLTLSAERLALERAEAELASNDGLSNKPVVLRSLQLGEVR